MAQKNTGDIIDPQVITSIQGEKIPIPLPSKFVHLQFRRFSGCPMCNLHIQSFIRRHAELVSKNVQEIAVFYSAPEVMLKRFSDVPFPLVADPEKSLYRLFSVESSIKALLHPFAMLAAVKGMVACGVSLPRSGESPLGLPADFLIDGDGRIIAAHYGAHAYDHWEVDQVLNLASKHTLASGD